MDHPENVPADQGLAVGVHGQAEDVSGMSFERAGRLAVGDGPATDDPVGAGRQQRLAVAGDGQGTDPAGVSRFRRVGVLDRPGRLGGIGGEVPADQGAVKVAADEPGAVGREHQAADPCRVTLEHCCCRFRWFLGLFVRFRLRFRFGWFRRRDQRPAEDLAVLGPGEHVTSVGAEAAAVELALVFERGVDPCLGDIKRGRSVQVEVVHLSTSAITSMSSWAIGSG